MGERALGLYVHWPYCLSKCPYCDFNAHPLDGGQRVDSARWIAAYRSELSALVTRFGARPFTSVFFGGGTPSLMPPEVTAAVLDTARELCGFRNDIEISLEANPGTVDAQRFADFRAVGINRLSLGIQSLRQDALTFFERAHDLDQARSAIETAQAHFENVSIDLIYARPDQSVEDWRAELNEALAYGLPHLSLYQLTIEPGTRFEADVRRGLFEPLDDEDRQVALWDAAQTACAAAGLENYEVSNFAKPGFDCRHNQIYWRGEDYFGIGPGAHGRVTGAGAHGRDTGSDSTRAFRMHRMPSIWLDRVAEQGIGLSGDDLQSPSDRAFERLMMGLRVTGGLPFADVAAFIDDRALGSVVDAGYAELENQQLRLTASGRLRLNAIFTHIWKGDA